MFDIGSYVIYGKAGVCKILDVTNRIKGEKRDKTYYVLEPIYDIGTIYSPVDNKKLKMRNLITKKEDKAVNFVSDVGKGDHITTQLRDGAVISIVEEVCKN